MKNSIVHSSIFTQINYIHVHEFVQAQYIFKFLKNERNYETVLWTTWHQLLQPLAELQGVRHIGLGLLDSDESLDSNAERLEPTEIARRINPSARWRRHLKEPACVVGEHRQSHLPLEDFLVAAPDVGISGDTFLCECECFLLLRSSAFRAGTLLLIRGDFLSCISSTFFLLMLL